MNPSQVHTFVAYVEDKPGVLNRVISLIRRRGYNIESLNVGNTERPAISQVTLVVRADPDTARRLVANLYKLINVLEVADLTQAPSLIRELALIHVKTRDGSHPEVLRACEQSRARVIKAEPGAVTFELTDSPEAIDALRKQLEPFGAVELVRTGAVAMPLGAQAKAWVAA